MHLCRRRARESYCTGNLMTQFLCFFFLLMQCTRRHGACLIFEGEGYIRMRLMNTVFPDAKLDDICIKTIPPSYTELHG